MYDKKIGMKNITETCMTIIIIDVIYQTTKDIDMMIDRIGILVVIINVINGWEKDKWDTMMVGINIGKGINIKINNIDIEIGHKVITVTSIIDRNQNKSVL